MDNNNNNWSRRTFISGIAGTGALALLSSMITWEMDGIDPKVAALVAKTIGIDTHNHVDVPLDGSISPETKEFLSDLIKQSGFAAICMTFAVDYQKLTQEGQAFDRFTFGLNAMDKLLEKNKIKRALNFSDIKIAHKQKQPVVIQSVEGGHFLEGKIERLQIAYNRGLRHLGLLHDNDASVPLGDIYTKEAKWGGLTSFGTQVIKECNKLGILIDLTHCSNDAINAALKISSKPMIVSHTGLDTQLGSNLPMAKMMKPRLISKEQSKIIAEAGGVIGVWTHLANSSLEYVQNIRALVDIVGINHVCIGTDTKLTPPYRPPFNPNAESPGKPDNLAGKDKERQMLPPPKNNVDRIGERTNLAWKDQKEGFFYEVAEAMLKSGFSDEEIQKIGGGNYCRVFDDATKTN